MAIGQKFHSFLSNPRWTLRRAWYYCNCKPRFKRYVWSDWVVDTSAITCSCVSLGERVYIGPRCRIMGIYRYLDSTFNPVIEFGDGVFIGQDFYLTCASRVTIGDNTAIAAFVTITDIDHPYTDPDTPIEQQPIKVKEVSIGSDCKIYNGAVITLGTRIGRHCVVGANSVVKGEFPDQYAFKYTTLDYTRTYAQFRDDVDDFARALVSLGVRRGSKVAIWATNVPAWFITFWAATKIGAVLVTVNTAYKIHEAEYLLRQSDTHTLVMIDHCLDSNYREIIQTLCPELAAAKPGSALHCRKLPFLRSVITVGFRMPGCLTFDEAMDRANMVPREQILRMAAGVRPDDVCNMQYTSGTTGFPKGVMLTHYNVVNDGKCIGDRMDLSTADRMMIQVPMFHCFGMVLSMTSCMTHGATLCPMPYFSAKVSLACINQERITCFNGVPTMFIAMFNHPDYKKTDFSYMRTGIMAGSGCPPELMRRAAQPDEMHMTDIVSVYGQTESAPGSTMSACGDPLDLRCNTVGYAFPHIECKIIDPETGEEVPDGVNGEFCSRGCNTMKGYYKMPEATAATIDKEGWLHSGDLACRDENGCYRITGRLKDMIIRGGENIYPKEIEEFIYTHPAVKDVQVIGVPDRKYGEEAMACIILKEPGSVTEDEMFAYIRASLARHKIPKYIRFTDAFPMNAAGKILKYKMREDATRELGLDGAAGIDTAKTAEQIR